MVVPQHWRYSRTGAKKRRTKFGNQFLKRVFVLTALGLDDAATIKPRFMPRPMGQLVKGGRTDADMVSVPTNRARSGMVMASLSGA